jgi:hypothetical protein
MTTLEKIGESRLYGPDRPDSGEAFAFLLSGSALEPPAKIPLEQTWSPDGPATYVGFHVFVDAVPSAPDAKALAEALDAKLPREPVTTGFAWAISPPHAFSLLGVVELTIVDGRPAVAADSAIAVRSPMPALTVPRGLAVDGREGLTGWSLTDPRGAGVGLDVTLLGRASATVRFQALRESRVDGGHTIKRLAAVSIDPLRPFDGKRTHIRMLDREYRLSVGPPGVYHLSQVTP